MLWSLGWGLTTRAGISVEEQFIVFGASGAVVYTLLTGVALLALRLRSIEHRTGSAPGLTP